MTDAQERLNTARMLNPTVYTQVLAAICARLAAEGDDARDIAKQAIEAADAVVLALTEVPESR